MRRSGLRMATAGACAAVTLVLAGCVPAPAGHLVFDAGTIVCGNSDSLRDATLGIPLHNEGPGTATIEGIGSGFTGAASQTGPWIVPALTDEMPIFLDAATPAQFVDWDARVDANGATLAEGEAAYLVLGLHLSDDETHATLGGVTVTYDDGRQSADAAGAGMKLAPAGEACEL